MSCSPKGGVGGYGGGGGGGSGVYIRRNTVNLIKLEESQIVQTKIRLFLLEHG